MGISNQEERADICHRRGGGISSERFGPKTERGGGNGNLLQKLTTRLGVVHRCHGGDFFIELVW